MFTLMLKGQIMSFHGFDHLQSEIAGIATRLETIERTNQREVNENVVRLMRGEPVGGVVTKKEFAELTTEVSQLAKRIKRLTKTVELLSLGADAEEIDEAAGG